MVWGRSKLAVRLANLEQANQALSRRASVLDSASGVGLWDAVLHDADALHPQSVWTWSPEFRRLCDYASEAEFPNVVQSWSDKLHPDDVPATFAAFANSLKTTTGVCSYTVEYRLKVRDGSYKWFRASGGCSLTPDRQVHACGSLIDIDAAKRAELAQADITTQQSTVVSELAAGLSRLAGGDLTCQLEQAFSASYDGLRTDFNTAVDRLHDAIGSVVGNAAALQSGAAEIAQASDDLSRRTEQQAASLEETAAALDEITATVGKTAAGAKQAGSTVATAKNDAVRSGTVVSDAVSAMGEIERSAHEISQIIGVIDEIAFQTNLLALNAGVEAARAGEAGRGFAVVASEVRALAQRSATAAKEIKALIQTSGEQVQRGVALVGATGEALTRITGQVGEVHDAIAEIAASAQEQATGLLQVNAAVNQMDQVTQQNAAMVEQSTAASHALSQETAELIQLTQLFRLRQTKAAPAAGRQRVAKPVPKPAPKPLASSAMKVTGRGGAVRKAEPETWEEF